MTQEELDKDMIESIEMWLHEIEPKWVEKELNWLEELRTRLLEEDTPNDLEEAADNHIREVVDAAGHPGWDWTTQDITEAFIAGASWQKNQMLKDYSWLVSPCANIEPKVEIIHTTDTAQVDGKELLYVADKSYKIGWRDCKEQMLKEAVEGKIGEVGFHNAVYLQEPKWTNFLDGFKKGDKVRIIIVKEDEK